MYLKRTKKPRSIWTLLDSFAFLLIMTLAVLCLSGCGTQIVYVPQYTLAAPPDALLVDCEIEPPPAQEHYLSLTYREKEGELTDVLTKNYGFQESCNKQHAQQRQWKADQVQLIERKNKEARDKAGAK